MGNASTIAAIATPLGQGGIGIVKLSGRESVSIADAIFRPSGKTRRPTGTSGEEVPGTRATHQLSHGHILDPDSNQILDEVLVSVMLAPNTYTREDVVEINAHSGPVVLEAILELVVRMGARLAEPGEFTKRAYLNGRIDLTQAEAVIDIINAKTSRSLQAATAQIRGELKGRIGKTRESLVALLTEVEAGIDFPDEVADLRDRRELGEFLQNSVAADLEGLIQSYRSSHVLRDGLNLIILGKPNVGKSSLLNRLASKDRVIVTSVPGTTRDLIDETVIIHGIPVVVTDTAGLQETGDEIEALGIGKTLARLEESDLVLFMVDASGPLSDADLRIYERIKERKHLLVLNKMDLVRSGSEVKIPRGWERAGAVRISALFNRGLDELKNGIKKKALHDCGFREGNSVIPSLRHVLSLQSSMESVTRAADGAKGDMPSEIIAIDLQEAIQSLGEIIGVTAREDVLETIFSRFCVGK